MNVSSAQSDMQQNTANSYVDAYSPPTSSPVMAAPQPSAPTNSYSPQSDFSSMTSAGTSQPVSGQPPQPSMDPLPAVTPPSFSAPDTSPSSATTPADTISTQPSTPTQMSTESSSSSETLEDQNIFFLLGVKDGTDQQKESFLDELQQVIWEDFLEYDVKLLITTDEMTELKKLLDSQTDRDLEKQEKIIVYLEKLIPDLEEIMLEKALELKEEMVRERVSGLRQYYADKPDKLQRVDEAERLMDSGKWYSAAHLMNSLANS